MPADWDEMERRARKKRLKKAEETQRKKDIAADEERLNKTVRREIEALKAEGIQRPFQVAGTGTSPKVSEMSFEEAKLHVAEGLNDFNEFKGAAGELYTSLTELRDNAQGIYEGVPGSSAAEEAAQLLESAVGNFDSILAEVTLAESKFEELQAYFNNPA